MKKASGRRKWSIFGWSRMRQAVYVRGWWEYRNVMGGDADQCALTRWCICLCLVSAAACRLCCTGRCDKKQICKRSKCPIVRGSPQFWLTARAPYFFSCESCLTIKEFRYTSALAPSACDFYCQTQVNVGICLRDLPKICLIRQNTIAPALARRHTQSSIASRGKALFRPPTTALEASPLRFD